jgi:hypothetical protein
MAAPNQRQAKFGIWLRKKRNFYLFSIASFGVASWLMLVWQFGHLGGALWIVFLFVVALLGALLWAFGMWHLFVLPLVKRLHGSTDAT